MGVTEISEGLLSLRDGDGDGDGTALQAVLQSESISRVSHAKSPFVTKLTRRLFLNSNEFRYEMEMATTDRGDGDGTTFTHLKSIMRRE